jgi:hypothetical protein
LRTTPTLTQSSSGAGAASIHQVCITHCLHDEGLYRRAGFGVRACSTRDPLLLRFALEYPSLEIPKDSRLAPRRLALVRIPGGSSALIHSVPLPDEERGRANNFFSHVLFRPRLGVREALATWGSPDWLTDCPPGADTDLPPLVDLPHPGPINDEAVTQFLRKVAGDDRNGTTLLWPERLHADVRRRRDLLCLALRGSLRALEAGPASPRGRFYLLAEPELTALLLYGVARLLPEALAANLTFSTYEHLHRDLRTYRHALVVATCSAEPEKGLPDGLFNARGYALDTYNHKFSPELATDGDLPVEDWVALAGRGDWATIDKVYALLGSSTRSVVSIKQGVQAAQLSQRLASGQAAAADLLALKGSAMGRPVLEQQRDQVWALLRDGGATDPRLRQEFADVLRDHLDDLEQELAQALARHPAEGWQAPWRLLCSILEEDLARLGAALQRAVPEPPYAPALRLELLRELHRAKLSPIDSRVGLQRVLKLCNGEELESISSSGLLHEWYAWALCFALARTETKAEAARRLLAAPDEVVRAFGEQVKLLKDEAQRRALLVPLFPANDPQAAAFLSRLLKNRCGLRGETLAWLLEARGAWEPERREFWGRENHLGQLLQILRDLGDDGRPVWERLLGQIDAEVLLPGAAYQQALLLDLAAARDAPGGAFPPHAAQTIADWVLLREHFEKASAVLPEARPPMLEACARLRLNAVTVLGRYFERFILPRGMNEAVLVDFAGFFHSFYAEPAEYAEHSSRLVGWLQVVAVCPEETQRAEYQRYYLEHHVPLEFRWRLAEEHKSGKLLQSVYEAVPRPTEPGEIRAEAGARSTHTPGDELFQLTGIVLAGDRPAGLLRSLGERLPWLLTTLGGGLLAATLSRVYLLPLQKVAGLFMFLPLVVAMAESMALQAAGVTVRLFRGQVPRALALAGELATALFLSMVCGVLAGSVAAAVGWPVRVALCLGGAVAGGMVSAAAIGFALAALVGLLHWDTRIAAGSLARALGGTAALLVYFVLVRWLLAN